MYIARNKASGIKFPVTAEQREKMLTHPLSKNKFTFVQGTLPKPPDETKDLAAAKKTAANKLKEGGNKQ